MTETDINRGGSMKKIIIFLIIAITIIVPAQASFFNDLLDRFMPQTEQSTPISHPEGSTLEGFVNSIKVLNTPSNIQALNREMDRYGYNAVRVSVPDYGYMNFFVVRNRGVMTYDEFYDALGERAKDDGYITLTRSQINRAYPILEKGELTWFGRIELWRIYTFN